MFVFFFPRLVWVALPNHLSLNIQSLSRVEVPLIEMTTLNGIVAKLAQLDFLANMEAEFDVPRDHSWEPFYERVTVEFRVNNNYIKLMFDVVDCSWEECVATCIKSDINSNIDDLLTQIGACFPQHMSDLEAYSFVDNAIKLKEQNDMASNLEEHRYGDRDYPGVKENPSEAVCEDDGNDDEIPW